MSHEIFSSSSPIIGKLFIVSAPSGAGKTSLVRALLEKDTAVHLSISYTTRSPRPGEVNGNDYHFVDINTFKEMIARNEFLEWAEVYGNYYGTSRVWIETQLNQGLDVLLEIDWQGAAQIKQIFPNAISLFIEPPSIEELERRLRTRGQDSEAVIQKRVHAAQEDMMHRNEFDYIIINSIFENALEDLLSVIKKARA